MSGESGRKLSLDRNWDTTYSENYAGGRGIVPQKVLLPIEKVWVSRGRPRPLKKSSSRREIGKASCLAEVYSQSFVIPLDQMSSHSSINSRSLCDGSFEDLELHSFKSGCFKKSKKSLIDLI